MINDSHWPLAILLLRVRRYASPTERAKVRVALTARASDERYAVLDVFEIDGNPVKDHATYDAVADLAERSDVRALLISQGLNYQRIRQIAVDMHMTVVNVSRPYWVGTTPVR